MRITVARLRTIIKEVLSDEQAEKLVGKYLWPKNRGLSVDEPDTEYEKYLFRMLDLSITSNNNPLSDKLVADLFDLADTGKYSDVLKFKKKGTVYRGINVTNEWLKTNFGIEKKDIATLPTLDLLKFANTPRTMAYGLKIREIPYSGGLRYGKQNQMSSWTTDINSTVDFAAGMSTGIKKASVQLVLVSDCSLGKFLDYKPFYKLNSHLSKKSKEAEIASFGPTPVTKAYILARDIELTPERLQQDAENDAASEKERIRRLTVIDPDPQLGPQGSAMTRLGHPMQRESKKR